MASNINLIAFGTFGNPNGFRQTFFVGSKELAKSVKTFDLNTNAIKLFPDAKIYAIRKEYAAGVNSIAYCLYSFAKEQNSDRSGTFIGSSILYTEKIADENITISQLNEFHSNLTVKNVQNGVIMVTHSDRFSATKPKEFEKIEYHLREIENLDFIQSTGRNLVVFSPTNEDSLNQLFKKSIDLLNVYDTIYFTDNREVAEFVNKKGIFEITQNVGEKLDFEQKIQNLLDERRRKREQSISNFEREVQRLNDDKIKTLNDFKLQIEQSERIHQENELKIKESRKDIETIDLLYNEFSIKTNELIKQIKSGIKLEDVNQLYYENRNRFIEGLNTLKRPNYINKLQKNNHKSNLKHEYQPPNNEHRQHRHKTENKEPEYECGLKFVIFKIVSLVLLLLLIFSWGYFLFYNNKNEESKIQHQKTISTSTPEQVKATPPVLQSLNPIPTSELNENDYRLVAKKLVYNSKIEEVVIIIFDRNPTDIKNHYTGQESIYSKHLLEMNKDCFKKKEGIYYFSKDTLRHIPSYKK